MQTSDTMMRLMQQEEVKAQLKGIGYEVTLTNWRVVARGESLGAAAEQIIPLECIDSVFIGTSRHNILLYLGIVAMIGVVMARSMSLLAAAVILLALWWVLAKRGAQIISLSGKTVIGIQTSGADGDDVTQFVDAVQESLRHRAK